jgi:hypothetical protein
VYRSRYTTVCMRRKMTFMLYPPKRTETNTIWVRNNLPPWSCRSTLCKARLIFSPSVDEYCMISEIQTSLLQELRGRVILSNFFLLFTVPFCIVCSFILLGIYATRFCAISTVTRPEEEYALADCICSEKLLGFSFVREMGLCAVLASPVSPRHSNSVHNRLAARALPQLGRDWGCAPWKPRARSAPCTHQAPLPGHYLAQNYVQHDSRSPSSLPRPMPSPHPIPSTPASAQPLQSLLFRQPQGKKLTFS